MTNMEYIESCKKHIEDYKRMLEDYKNSIKESKEFVKINVSSAKFFREINKEKKINMINIKETIKDLKQEIKDRKTKK